MKGAVLMICEKCGQQLSEGSRFCIFCGAKVEAAEAISETAAVSESTVEQVQEVPEVSREPVDEPAQSAGSEAVQPEQPKAEPQPQAQPVYTSQPQAQPIYTSQTQDMYTPQAQPAYAERSSKTAPLPVWKYIGIFLLTSIPIIGAIMIIVWSFGSSFNKNTQNYARAVLILFILSFILSIVGVIMFWETVRHIIENLADFYYYYGF